MRLGDRIRQRRRQLLMSQVDLAEGFCTRSFISQIEIGKVTPSLENLSIIASRLDITVGELIGDQQSLAAAKATLFTPELCKDFLKNVPDTPTKRILSHLADCLLTNATPETQESLNGEMAYFTAKVHIYQGNYRKAIGTLSEGFKYADRFWKIRILKQLHLCQQELGDIDACVETLTLLESICEDLQNIDDLQDYIDKDLKIEGASLYAAKVAEIAGGLEWAKELSQALELVNGDVD